MEDERDIAIGIQDYLTNQGYQVFIASNGIEGLEIIEKEKVHHNLMLQGVTIDNKGLG